MTLAAGTRLGSFEISGRIGAGGMGEVYRATDTRLGREVAIKTLPAALAEDKDRLARFEREAKLLASLHHAHIASVFSLDEHDGTLYIAMELVEGETLEEKLKSGALPVEDALQLGLQIALALEAAHEKGVIHRDLKPANIMVTPDGVVKVLDFGLAKALSGAPHEASPGRSPALSLAMNQQGLILGTAGYMSPEQASGQATDQRADVWAFGVVLYEMLTGMPVFSGESVQHVLAEVLKTEPNWSRLPGNLHPRLRLLLERCLTKKPRNRYHSIADARIEIENVIADPDGAATPRPASSRWRTAVPAAAGAAIAAALVVWTLLSTEPAVAPEPEPVMRFALNLDTDTVEPPDDASPGLPGGIPRGIHSSLAWSNAGDLLVYSGLAVGTSTRLYLRRMDAERAEPIPGTDQARIPFFSPDDAWLAYFVGPTLRRLSLATGMVETIVADVGATDRIYGAAWGDDGTIVYALETELYRVAANGGEPQLLASTRGDASRFFWYKQPEFLPGSDVLIYHNQATSEDPSEAFLAALDLETGVETTLLTDAMDPHYLAATGHLLFARQGSLLAVGFDPDSLTILGSPFVVVDDVMLAIGTRSTNTETGAAQFAVSRAGHLAYLGGGMFPGDEMLIMRLTADGAEERLIQDPEFYVYPVISPDGNRLAFSIRQGRGSSLHVHDLARGVTRRLNTGSFSASIPIWSPDGSSLLLSMSDPAGLTNIYRVPVDGSGEPEHLAPSPTVQYATDWSAAGDIAYVQLRDDQLDIWVLPPDGEPMPFLATDAQESHATFSHDGRWLAYMSVESGRSELYVRPYPGPGPAVQISGNGGTSPAWSQDDSQLFYLERGNPVRMMVVDVTPGVPFVAGRPAPFIEPWVAGTYAPRRAYDVLPDRSVMTAMPIQEILARDDPAAAQERLIDNLLAREIHVVLNFADELRRRAGE